MIAILFEQQEPPAQYAVVGLITKIKARNRPDRLKKADQATQATPEFAREVILSKCNAHTYEVALLRGLALEFFAAGPCAAILQRYPGIQMYELASRRAPRQVRVFDVFALGQTKPAKELLAVAQHFSFCVWNFCGPTWAQHRPQTPLKPFFLLAGQLVNVTWSCKFIIGRWEMKICTRFSNWGEALFVQMKHVRHPGA